MGWLIAWKTAPQWVRTMALGVLFLVLILICMLALSRWVDDVRLDAVEQGQIKEREAATGIIIKKVEEANDAKQEIQAELNTGYGNELHAQCLRSARTPANCKRFLPDK